VEENTYYIMELSTPAYPKLGLKSPLGDGLPFSPTLAHPGREVLVPTLLWHLTSDVRGNGEAASLKNILSSQSTVRIRIRGFETAGNLIAGDLTSQKNGILINTSMTFSTLPSHF
jgi:hypothetical protein